ncbi:hypothetical protein NQ317_011213 [Molorchus minor]|uniref:DDE-1 domain-containing protein n=1 Tax=Molorchus minor TaxID=1323400 RepID=A0ABQ9JH40_9CUCU|nr:hypothetical protein NQ317_011213 [Molorchus minor]
MQNTDQTRVRNPRIAIDNTAAQICSEIEQTDRPRRKSEEIKSVAQNAAKIHTEVSSFVDEGGFTNSLEKVRNKSLNANKASQIYRIPYRTLRRRIAANNSSKMTLGKHPSLGIEYEKRLVKHIQRLQDSGLARTAQIVCHIAYSFAKSLGKEHIFGPKGSKEERAEKVKDCLARAKGMNRVKVAQFYNLLEDNLVTHNLQDKPNKIFNMDETGIQLINKPGKVVAIKGSKCVHSVTSKEKGETISLIACNNAEGVFLPPVLIMKGVRSFDSRLNGLPQGTSIYMNKKFSYINSDLFLKWMKEIFLPRKPEGKVLLILDGHSSHASYDVIQLANENDIIILYLPSHTTQAQPLDKSFFKVLKEYYKQEAQDWMVTNKEKKISRDSVGIVIGNAWKGAATSKKRNAIPDYFFSISDALQNNNATVVKEASVDKNFLENDNYIFLFNGDGNDVAFETENNEITQSTSNMLIEEVPAETPSKILFEVALVPQIPCGTSKYKQSVKILIHDVSIVKPGMSVKCGKSQKVAKNKEERATVATSVVRSIYRRRRGDVGKIALVRENPIAVKTVPTQWVRLITTALFSEPGDTGLAVDRWITEKFRSRKAGGTARTTTAKGRGRNYAQRNTGRGPRASAYKKAQDLFLKNRKALVDTLLAGKPLDQPSTEHPTMQSQRAWEGNNEVGQWTKRLIPDVRRWAKCRHRRCDYYTTQGLTGHGSFKAYTKRIGKTEDEECIYCGAIDTVEHTLFQCERWERVRNESSRKMGLALSPENLVNEMINDQKQWIIGQEMIRRIMEEKEKEERASQEKGRRRERE